MQKSYGLSLVEVLVSLSIFSMSSLALFKHQWQLTKQYQFYQQQVLAQQLLDDASEALLWRFEMPVALTLRITRELHGTFSSITDRPSSYVLLNFQSNEPSHSHARSLRREL